MKKKIRCTFWIPRRLYKILKDISPLFLDFELNDPSRGAMTRALEHILQYYLESEEYQKQMRVRKEFAKRFFEYLCDKDKAAIENVIKEVSAR